MKRFDNPLLSLAAPFLILIAIFGFLQRSGGERFQTLPALLIGGGLIVSGDLARRRRRSQLLLEIRKNNEKEN